MARRPGQPFFDSAASTVDPFKPSTGPGAMNGSDPQARNSAGAFLFDQNGNPTFVDSQGRQYNLIDGKPVYGQPIGLTGTGGVSYDPRTAIHQPDNGGLIHNPDFWDPSTGTYKPGGINWGALGSYLGLGAIGAGVGAAALAGGAGAGAAGGGGAAAGSAGAAVPATVGVDSAAAAALPGAVAAPTIGAAGGAAGAAGAGAASAALPSAAISPVGGLATGTTSSLGSGMGFWGSLGSAAEDYFSDPSNYVDLARSLTSASNAAGNNRLTGDQIQTQRDRLSLEGQNSYEQQLLSRAILEARQRSQAQRDLARNNFLLNAGNRPTNLPPINPAYAATLQSQMPQLTADATRPPQYNTNQMPALTQFRPTGATPPSFWEKIGSGLGTGLGIVGAATGGYRK